MSLGSHRLDGVFWPLAGNHGTPSRPVVLLEVQMHADATFHHRLAAQTYRFLQQHPKVQEWRLVVLVPHRRLSLGPITPLRRFLEQEVILGQPGGAQPPPGPRSTAGAAHPVGQANQRIGGHEPEAAAPPPRPDQRRPDFALAATTAFEQRGDHGDRRHPDR